MATSTSAPDAKNEQSGAVNPEPIMRLASGFMAAKHLFAASELGLFEALADSPTTIDRLAVRNGLIRRAARISADAGSSLLLADFWTDPTHTRPVQAALIAAEFAIQVRNGDVYSVEEAKGWLGETGWRFIRYAPLAGSQSLIVAEAA